MQTHINSDDFPRINLAGMRLFNYSTVTTYKTTSQKESNLPQQVTNQLITYSLIRKVDID